MSIERRNSIEKIIKSSLLNKLNNYHPETNYMPFHFALLGKDKLAVYSFIHSLNTSFGTSIFEPVAEVIASEKFIAQKQFEIGKCISSGAQSEIQSIINSLSTGGISNKEEEIQRIRAVCRQGQQCKVKTVKADIRLIDKQGKFYLIDIKTVKPNISNFKDFKRTLLEWIAILLYSDPYADVNSYIAIPYNPYHPEPYQRWTMRGMFDLDNELLVAEDFWNFLGGENSYDELLDSFEKVGIEVRDILDEYFQTHYRA